MSKCVVYEAETSTMFQRCGGCGGRNSNFPYRKLFTPDLNVFSLYKSYYIILHTLHHPSLISTEPKYVQGFRKRVAFGEKSYKTVQNISNLLLLLLDFTDLQDF